MADIYATITQADPATVAIVAQAMEGRAADKRQADMRDAFLNAIALPTDAKVVEIGCGTGSVCRALAMRPGVGEITGVDPSRVLLKTARELAGGLSNVRFVEADGRATGLDDSCCDVVVIYTTLCHVPGPEQILKEAFRLLRPGGTIDGDNATGSVALDSDDPLQCCISAFLDSFCHAPWIMRRVSPMLRATGFEDLRTMGHGYSAVDQPEYMLSLVRRGADALQGAGIIGTALADALKAEADDRAVTGRFFGQIAYFHAIGRKPGT